MMVIVVATGSNDDKKTLMIIMNSIQKQQILVGMMILNSITSSNICIDNPNPLPNKPLSGTAEFCDSRCMGLRC